MFQKIVTVVEVLGLIAFFCCAGVLSWSMSAIIAVAFFLAACAVVYGGVRTVFCGSRLLRAPLGDGVLDLCMLIFLPLSAEWGNVQEMVLFYLPAVLAAIDLCLIVFDKQVRKQQFFASERYSFGNILLDCVLLVYGLVSFYDSESYRFVGLLVAVATLVDLIFSLKHANNN